MNFHRNGGTTVVSLSDTELSALHDALVYAQEMQGKRVNSLKAGSNKRLDEAGRFRRFAVAVNAIGPAFDAFHDERMERLKSSLEPSA